MQILLVFLLAILMSGCELVGDIFKAGVAAGVALVVLVVALVLWLLAKVRRRS